MSEIIDQTRGSLDSALIYATSIQDDSLNECLERLKRYSEFTEIFNYSDPAPYSFYFVKEDKYKGYLGDGEIIFHGSHDDFGNGSAPTFSVTMEPIKGWRIHT